MKKVLILSYYYPPANFVGAERIASWAKYLNESDIYPIIVTRNWNEGQLNIYDEIIENTYKIKKLGTYEVHYLPFKQSLRDKLFSFKSTIITRMIRKILTFFDIVLSPLSIHFSNYKNLYTKSLEILNSDDEVKTVIVSGMPFEAFLFGYKLKKRKPDISWIPDYRDEWTTFQDLEKESMMNKLILKYNKFFEKKWSSNCHFFITVSENWAQNIGKFIKKEGKVVMNGYEPYFIESETTQTNNNIFKICYNGTIYSIQDFSILISSVKKMIEKFEDKIHIELKFIGLTEQDPNIVKIRAQLGKHSDCLELVQRIPKKELITEMANSDLMLMTKYGKVKGWFPVKLFDYLMIEKPILLCPTDDDCIEKFIIDTNSGYFANDEESCCLILQELISTKLEGNCPRLEINKELSSFYSRKHQSKILGNLLK